MQYTTLYHPSSRLSSHVNLLLLSSPHRFSVSIYWVPLPPSLSWWPHSTRVPLIPLAPHLLSWSYKCTTCASYPRHTFPSPLFPSYNSRPPFFHPHTNESCKTNTLKILIYTRIFAISESI